WKLGSAASAGVGFYHGSSRAAILNNLESPAQQREERDSVFQDYHVTALFLFRGDLLRVYVLHPHLVRPVQPQLAERIIPLRRTFSQRVGLEESPPDSFST